MDGFLPHQEGPDVPGVVELPSGVAVTRAPAVDGVVEPEMAVTEGEAVTAAVTAQQDGGWVGIQWVSTDGTPGDVTWGGGVVGRITVTAVAPPGAVGLRMVLATYAEEDPEGTNADSAALLASLRTHIEEQ